MDAKCLAKTPSEPLFEALSTELSRDPKWDHIWGHFCLKWGAENGPVFGPV